MSESGVDPQKVLKTLSTVASSQDFGAVPSGLFQTTFGRSEVSSTAKTLASDFVHLRSLHDADWDVVAQSVKEGLSSPEPDSQATALQLLPSLPSQHLTNLMLRDEIGDFVVNCLDEGHADVRAAAVAVLGHLLIQVDVIKSLARDAGKTKACTEYWTQICDSLVDADDQVAGTAFSAVRSLMEENRVQQKNESLAWRSLLSQWNEQCFRAIHKHLAAILYRAKKLDAAGLVSAIQVVRSVGMDVLTAEIRKTAEQQIALWVLPSIIRFLEECVASADVGVIFQSASSLLELCRECPNRQPESWTVSATLSFEACSAKAILALESLVDSKDCVPSRGDIIFKITAHLTLLELSEIGLIAKRLLQSISTLPRSSDRTRSLMHLWRSVLKCDLKIRRLQRTRGDAAQGTSLQALLESPFFSGIVSGQQKQQADFLMTKAISRASYPAFKQELVSSLAEVMLEHAEGFDMGAIFPPKNTDSKTELTLDSVIQSDFQTDVVDWFASSVVALYLTQACLGWDNAVAEGYYGLTLPADLWLQLLQLTSQTLYTILGHYNIRFVTELQTLDPEKTKSRRGKILKMLAGEAFEIQKLMKRMVFFWSFLNAALKPRVLWIVSHHIDLPDRPEDIWSYLVDGLKDLLIVRPTEIAKRQHDDRIAAGKKGLLGPEHDTVYNLKSTEDSKQPLIAYNQSEVALEGMTVGLLCLSKLAEHLLSQYQFAEFYKIYPRVSEIAKILKTVCNKVLEEDFLTVDMFDQCKAVLKQLDFLTDNPPENVQTESNAEGAVDSAEGQASEQSVTFLPVDLVAKEREGFPFSNSLSLGFVSNKRSRRHKTLRKHLQQGREDALRLSPVTPSTERRVLPIPERPSAVDLAAAVGGLHLREAETDWQILTGQGDPIQLSLRHRVDALSRTLEIEISATNRMGTEDFTGVAVSFAIEGPVATDREGLIVWHPEKLPAQEPAMHRFELSMTEFGAIEIQPFMDVALSEADDETPELSCKAYTIPLIDQLVPVSVTPSARVYFQEVASWPERLNTTAVCRWPGTNGAMQLLSALNQSHLKKIWPDAMRSLSLFQAIYVMQTFNDHWISFCITGQLTDLQRMGLAAWAIPAEHEAPGNVGYYLCKCTFASTSARALAAIRGQTSELLSNLSSGGLALGLDPGVGHPPPPPPIHPACHVDLGHTDMPSQMLDLQSIALAEWKRLNQSVAR